MRNPNYDPATDDTTIRRALPDKVVYLEGLATETIFSRLLADQGNDQFLVTDPNCPPADLVQCASKKQFTDSSSPFVDYLLPNFKKLTNPLVREALATATTVPATSRPRVVLRWRTRRTP